MGTHATYWFSSIDLVAERGGCQGDPMRAEAPTPKDTELTERVIEQGRALVHAIEGLRVIEPSGWFERAIAGLLLAAYRRRLKMIIATAPSWVGGRILSAAEGVGQTVLFGQN